MSRAKDARIANLQEALRISAYRLIAASRFAPTVWQKDQIQAWADDAIRAQGTEAQRATTENTGVVHDGPVCEADAPNPSYSTPPSIGGILHE